MTQQVVSFDKTQWKACKLGDVAEVQTGPFGSQLKNEQYITGGTPVVTVEHIANFRINNFDYPSVTDADKQRLMRYSLKSGDIVFSRVGSVDLSAYIKPSQDGWLFSSRMLRVRVNSEIDAKYLSYFFQQKSFREYLINISVGATMPSINTEILKGVDISFPPLPEQKEIAEILSSLDDKIDLLHRQNKTLESMAQTLFRQWFIEEANEEWGEKSLSKIADFLNGLACQKFPPENDINKLPVLKIKDLKDGISENSDYATSDVKPEYIVNNGDVIFAWSASLMVKIWDGEQCVLNQHLFKVTSKDFPKWFYYHWCKYHLDNFIAISSAHATTMGHIKRTDLDDAICVIPPSEEIIRMGDKIAPLFEKIEINSKQIKHLEKMRDDLLVRLMGGGV